MADEFELHPTAEQVEQFREEGFLVVERITTDEELARIAAVLERVFSPEEADAFGAPVDRSGTVDDGAPSTLSQAFFPEMRFPELLDTTLRRNAIRMAAGLLGVEAELLSTWGHAIRKLPGGRAAPWHQDQAYWEPELDHLALGCWTPMHDVTTDMGAMQFVPGSHRRGLLPHRHADDPALNLLVVEDGVDTSGAVPCELPAGGATFHHFRTLHHTAPNTTDRVRLAYPMEVQVAPTRRADPRPMPWVDEHRVALGQPASGGMVGYVADGRYVPIPA